MRITIANLTSNRLAFVLMAVLLAFIILSAIIPQRDLASGQMLDWHQTLGSNYAAIEKLRLDRIYFSPPFFIVLGLLGINLLAANLKRFRLVYRVEGTLLRARHLGSIVFHLALLVIMAAVILNYLFKFQGVFGITEGQTARDGDGGYFRQFAGPLYEFGDDRFRITLEEVDTGYRVGSVATEAARILVQPAGSTEQIPAVIRINEPLEWRGLEFHLGAKTGFSPEVMVMTASGEVRFRSFVRLATRHIDGRDVYRDYVPLGDQRDLLGVEIVASEGEGIRQLAWIERDGERLFEAAVAPGDTVQFEDRRIAIPRLRRWCFVQVVESPYLNAVFGGFWLALGGMVVGFVPRIVTRRNRRP